MRENPFRQRLGPVADGHKGSLDDLGRSRTRFFVNGDGKQGFLGVLDNESTELFDDDEHGRELCDVAIERPVELGRRSCR
jgi:hypothetical protein